MPSKTVSTSAANFTRIIDALDRRIDREEGETDSQFYTRWLKATHIELVFKDERTQAQGAVVAESNIAEVT